MIVSFLRKLRRSRRGQSMVEYGILVGAIAVVALAATSLLGHKISSLIGVSAAVLPGAHTDDNGMVFAGHLTQTQGTGTAADPIRLSSTPGDLGTNLGLGLNGATSLVTDTPPAAAGS